MPKARDELLDYRDLMITPGGHTGPLSLALRLGCLASILLALVSWAGLGALFVWQDWPFILWPFVTVPLALWVLVILAPAFVKMQRGTMAILEAIVMTAEAYLARAGWVVDLNSDGVIGHVKPVPSAIQDVRPIIFRGRLREEHKAPRLTAPPVADQAEDRVGGATGLSQPQQGAATTEPVRVKVWHLPNGEKIHQADLCQFVDGIFTKGWARDTWLGQGMRREVYDGCLALLEDAKIITDRKRGFQGRLNVRNPGQARRVLDLPLEDQ